MAHLQRSGEGTVRPNDRLGIPRWQNTRPGLAIVLVALLVVACFEQTPPYDPTGVVNDTALTVDISQVVGGKEEHVTRLLPNHAVGWIFAYKVNEHSVPCTTSDLVLRDEDGAELARIPPPLCFIGRIHLSTYLPDAPRYSPNP